VCLRCEGEAGIEGAPGVGEAAGPRPRQHRSAAGGGDVAVHARARPRPGARASLPCHPLAAWRVSPGMCEVIAGLLLFAKLALDAAFFSRFLDVHLQRPPTPEKYEQVAHDGVPMHGRSGSLRVSRCSVSITILLPGCR
jgi:hypothetical protein